jgi:hypothetical protein
MARDTRRSKDSTVKSARAVRALSTKQRSKIPWLIGGAVTVIAIAGGGGCRSWPHSDGIEAGSMEQLLFHIHAHLAIYVHGQQKFVPYGIGIVPPYKLQDTPTDRSSAAGASSTGFTRMTKPASSTSSPRNSAPSRSATYSTSGISR